MIAQPIFTFVRYTGRVELDPLRSEQINLRDIAFHVSRIRRFNHASNISVGVHLLCAERLSTLRKHSLRRRLLHLLHDAHETYVVDMARPIKRSLPDYLALEAACERAVCTHFDVHDEPDGYADIDNYLLGCEIAHQFANEPPTLTTQPIEDPLVHAWFDYFLQFNETEIERAYLTRANDLLTRRMNDHG